MQVTSLTVYPLKGAAGHALPQARILASGIENDRRFVLVDEAGRFISQRTHPTLALVRVTLEPPGLVLEVGGRTLRLARASGPERAIEVWRDQVMAQDWGDEASRFLHDALGQPIRLCERLPHAPRHAPRAYTAGQVIPYFFADAFPLLVTTQESLDALNDRLAARGEPPVAMDRFRPNIVIAGWAAHGEDQASRLRIGDELELALAKPCGRCVATTVDQTTGIAGVEPLRTLATYRRGEDGAVHFGQNAYVVRGEGAVIRLGDPVEPVA